LSGRPGDSLRRESFFYKKDSRQAGMTEAALLMVLLEMYYQLFATLGMALLSDKLIALLLQTALHIPHP
jgi:hypothetical protein